MASRVGKYLLFETLGEGAFGKVKLGVHEETGEQVAVKIMDKSDIKAQEMTMNVRREIAIMKALKHRNIVNLRQVLTSQSKLYIVMDLVTGGELFTKILNEGKLEETIARRYFQQLVDGIEYCHRRGVCHRDLKPENLLIDESTGELKITDFGLSAMKGASTTEELLHTQCGSPNYCAPEIIARHKQGYNGNKVDAWSCGIILFALLAGFLPFFDENTRVLYRMIQRDDVKFPRKFPVDAKDLVLRLLHKEPEERYTLAEVKMHPWFAVDYDGDDSAPRSGSGASPPVSRRRKRSGHSRKSSVDQGPRSREMVPRRRSDKSDNDGAAPSASGLPSNPPSPGQPAPPPILAEAPPRIIPLQHRRPPTPPPPPSPLPPLPPMTAIPIRVPAPPIPVTHASPLPALKVAPLPPPPPPPPLPSTPQVRVAHPLPSVTLPAVTPPIPREPAFPPMTPAVPSVAPQPPSPQVPSCAPGSQGLVRPVPPYPATDLARRKSRELRGSQSPANDVASVTSVDSGSGASVPNSVNSSAVPSYSSLPGAAALSQLSTPPPFPAPEVLAERMDTQTYRPAPGAGNLVLSTIERENASPLPAKFPAHPPSPDTVESGRSAVPHSTAPISALTGHESTHVTSILLPNKDGIMGKKMAVAGDPYDPRSAKNSSTVSSELCSAPEPPSPVEEIPIQRKSSASPPRSGRSRWKVSGAPPPPSYTVTAMPPVTTPAAFASGDASWLKGSRSREVEKSPSGIVSFELKGTGERTNLELEERKLQLSKGRKSETEEDSELDREPAQPLSLVAQRRLLYSKEPTGFEMPPPFPDPLVRKSFKNGSTVPTHRDQTELVPPRFSDRQETPAVARYPKQDPDCESAKDMASPEPQVPLSDPEVRGDASQLNVAGSLGVSNIARVENDVLPARNEAELPDEPHVAVFEETKVELVGNTTGSISLGPGVMVAREDDTISVPLKQRLAATLARYRRIFKLGTNIGITASPSFSSNKGSIASECSGEDDLKKASGRAEFFARAKAITGAWGIILTQELDEDSDSEEDDIQVTEAELQAFSRLLDFWDNRRTSASVPKGTEVVLDDENTSPLSEEDVLSIQSLLQKLEPKQVEEEMMDVVEDDNEGAPALSPEQSEAANGDNDDSLEDLQLEDIRPVNGGEGSARLSDLSPRSGPWSAGQTPSLTVDHAQPGSNRITGPVSSPPVLPPPRPALGMKFPMRSTPPPPPPNVPTRPTAHESVSWDRSTDSPRRRAIVPPPPPPPAALAVAERQQNVRPVVPPSSEVVSSFSPVAANATDNRRMVPTQSTVLDPFRPKVRPPYPPPQTTGNGSVPLLDEDDVESKAVVEARDALSKGARIPPSLSHDVDLSLRKRKSSTSAPDRDVDSRKTTSRDSVQTRSGASEGSGGMGLGASKRGHFRSPSRDEHATRGMFTFGMFNRRKTSSITSFDSDLSPDRCMVEIGRILTSFGCHVLMKRGESKMKCEAPLKQEKLLISITCTTEKNVSTVHFKKGRRDRSQVDAKEFFEFFQKVHHRFLDRIGSEGRAQ